MDITTIWEDLVWDRGGNIIYLILDGLGGIPHPDTGCTELQAAKTPNLDALATQSSCGLLEIVGPGITPGSGPGHLTLFGYDPIKYRVGRGVLSALGIDFDLQPGDVAARVNFATVDEDGIVTDRRAGRIETDLNRQLAQKIQSQVNLDFEGTYFFETVSEHRAVLVLRGKGLSGNLQDTDPQSTGIPYRDPKADSDEAEATALLVQSFLHQVRPVLASETKANMVLLRGFEQYQPLPSLQDRFALKGICIADYPMYRGVSRLIGMDVVSPPGGLEQRFEKLASIYGHENYNFYFIHVKKTDSLGEDADFDSKVSKLEQVDRLLPHITGLNPEVLIVTADHSTPAVMGRHSWHPVPVMLRGPFARVDQVQCFEDYACAQGMLGLRPGTHLMGLALANASRMRKYGA